MQLSSPRLTGKILLLAAIVVFAPCVCFAASPDKAAAGAKGALDSPAQALRGVIERLRHEGSLVALCEYVDWPTAFQRSTETSLKEKGARSAKELEEYYRTLFGNAPAFVRRQISRERDVLPDEDRREFDRELKDGGYDYLIDEIEKSHREIRKNLKGMAYKIGETKYSGDSAEVQLEMVVDGEKSVVSIEMVNRAGRWVFPSLDSLDEAESVLGQAQGA